MQISNKWTRISLAILIGPLPALVIGSVTLSSIMGFRLSNSIEFLLPETYLFTIFWGMGTFLLLEHFGKTQLTYYLGSYLIAAVSAVLFLLRGDFDLILLAIFSIFILIGAGVPIVCWWLHYRYWA